MLTIPEYLLIIWTWIYKWKHTILNEDVIGWDALNKLILDCKDIPLNLDNESKIIVIV